MKKILVAVILTIAATLIFGFISQTPKTVLEADKAVYTFIKASVEADHPLRKTVLVKRDQDILDDSQVLYPGDAKKMGGRYFIKRFDHMINENKIYYYIEYYFPNNERDYAMNLLMVKGADGKWRSSSLTGITSDDMRAAIAGHEKDGVIVHEYKERMQ